MIPKTLTVPSAVARPLSTLKIPGDLRTARLYAVCGIVALGLTSAIVYVLVVQLTRGTSYLIIGDAILALLFLLIADHTFAVAVGIGAERRVDIKPDKIDGVLLPPRYTFERDGIVRFRSPILHVTKAWYPKEGVPWAGVRILVIGPSICSDRSVLVRLRPDGVRCGGELLFPRRSFVLSRDAFLIAAGKVLAAGSSMDLLMWRRFPGLSSGGPSFGRPVRRGGWLRLRPDLTSDDLGAVFFFLTAGRFGVSEAR